MKDLHVFHYDAFTTIPNRPGNRYSLWRDGGLLFNLHKAGAKLGKACCGARAIAKHKAETAELKLKRRSRLRVRWTFL
ncbi:hypothetical protein A7975_05465 [Bacillus sp. FJAT-26390]|nr:hypothetical protein A7975_05465 [Bacillus sp. FJAT-26390]